MRAGALLNRLAICALPVALAVGAVVLRDGDPPPAPADGEPLAVAAHLLELPRAGQFGASAVVEVARGPLAGARLLARLPRATPPLAVGAELRMAGTFRRARASAGPGDFDFAAHLRRRGIAGELAVSRVRVTGARRGGWRGVVDGIRARALAAIAAGLSPRSAALAHGMVLGVDGEVPPALREDFRDSGLAHVLAASGQNVMLLVALALPLLAAAGLGHRARIVALLALVALYVPLAGAEPPIQRAGVMAAAGLLAMLLARPASRWYALLLAACATVALRPRVWEEAGWQLSFAAVAGILILAPAVRRRLRAVPRALAEGVAMTVAATVATAPLLAHHFGAVSLMALPANVVALALVAPIMWLGMLRGLVGQLAGTEAMGAGPAAEAANVANGALGMLLGPLLGAIERVAGLFADGPGSRLEVTLAGPAEVAGAYVVLATIALAVRHGARRSGDRATVVAAYVRRLPRARRGALVAGGLAVVALVAARGLAPEGPPARLTVSFLDVGQGDATLIQHPDGSAVLFDGGPPEGGVLRLLRRAGVRRLSALVLTHQSRDHHGGAAAVVERVPTDVVLNGGDGTRDPSFRAVVSAAGARGARVVAAVAPLTLRAGGLRIDVHSPPPRAPGPPPADPNPRAVVAVVSADGFDLLLSADAESEALLPLALPAVDALKIPHHGSADAGLGEVLERLRPRLAAIPVGPNGYGHPAPSTLSTLRVARVPTWRTDLHGTVRVTAAGGALHVAPERGDPATIGP